MNEQWCRSWGSLFKPVTHKTPVFLKASMAHFQDALGKAQRTMPKRITHAGTINTIGQNPCAVADASRPIVTGLKRDPHDRYYRSFISKS